MSKQLDDLIAAVEAGGDDLKVLELSSPFGRNYVFIIDAYRGSLDAAQALHDALLPGASAVIQTNGIAQTIGPDHERHTGTASDKPARAWLIAILKAYRDLLTK